MAHEDFVTYDQAVKLKELGFDWKTHAFYNKEGDLYSSDNPDYWNDEIWNEFSAPTLAQAQKWLREKEIEVGVFSEFDGELRTGKWVWLMRKFNTHLFDTVFPEDINYDTYEEALSAGIDRAIELIK